MLGVLHGFGVIAIIIAIGYLLGRLRILSEEMARGLNNICFWIATPSLLFDTLIKADLKSVFSVHLSVAVFANAVTSLLFILISYLWLKRKPAELVIGGLAAGYVNSANLGIPIALYVIHDTTAFVPILLFQTILLCPLTLSLLDYLVLDHSEQKTWERLLQTLKNPMVIFGLAGLIFALGHWTPPTIVSEPLHLIGQTAVPCGLLGFGHSFYGVKVMEKGITPRRDVALAVTLKSVVMPFIAWLFGRFALHLDPQTLFAVCVCAALPTAVNVYIFATRYNTARYLARDAGFLSTILAIPVILIISALLLPT